MSSPLLPPAPAPSAAPALSWYRRLYTWVEGLANTRYAVGAMLVVAFLDASLFPIPPFALLIPMVAMSPQRWWRLSLGATLASLVGGVFGYYLGAFLQDTILDLLKLNLNLPIHIDFTLPLVDWHVALHSTVRELLARNFLWLALLCSVLPTPFKLVAIGCGAVGLPLEKFLLAAVLGRSVRMFGIVGAVAFGGARARKWLRV